MEFWALSVSTITILETSKMGDDGLETTAGEVLPIQSPLVMVEKDPEQISLNGGRVTVCTIFWRYQHIAQLNACATDQQRLLSRFEKSRPSQGDTVQGASGRRFNRGQGQQGQLIN